MTSTNHKTFPKPNCGPLINNTQSSQKKVRLCEMCKNEIPLDASLCAHCHYHQKGWIRKIQLRIPFINTGLATLGFLVTFGMLIAGFIQLNEARTERIAAATALTKAKLAAQQAQASKSASIRVLKVVRKLVSIHDPHMADIVLNYNPIASNKNMLLKEIDNVLAKEKPTP